MNSRLRRKLIDAITSELAAGESIELTGRGRVATAPHSAVGAAASAIAKVNTVGQLRRERFLVLTDRRFLLVAPSRGYQPTSKIVGVIDREHLSAARLTGGLLASIDVGDGSTTLRLTFPLPDRTFAKELAAALGVPQD
ncbi:MAG TPA: hypothetical protein VGL39_15225 [Jatrophihabitantaceae bacterium]|jgi:hypothetical protein